MPTACMSPQTQCALLTLNRRFYEQVAHHFDATRQSWTPGLRAILPYFRATGKERLTVLDVGCGNGRFARLLEEAGVDASYTGVDGSSRLLRIARDSTASLTHVDCQFMQADLACAGWYSDLAAHRRVKDKGIGRSVQTVAAPKYGVVLCTATVQHLPGYGLRLRLMRDLKRLSAGIVILSFWQFLSSERFRKRLIEPGEAGISAADLEPGDGFLPWRQGVESIRYVHQIDETEMRQLASDSGQTVVHSFRADGKERDLNLYAVLGPTSSAKDRL